MKDKKARHIAKKYESVFNKEPDMPVDAEKREAVLTELRWLEQAIRDEGKPFIRQRIAYIEQYETGHNHNN